MAVRSAAGRGSVAGNNGTQSRPARCLDDQGPGQYLAVDSEGRLAEVGRLELPSLIHMAWAAQYMHHRQRRQQELAAQDAAGALTVTLFEAGVSQRRLPVVMGPAGSRQASESCLLAAGVRPCK